MTLAASANNLRPDSTPRCWALVPCAGSGSRAGTARPKQYQVLHGQMLVRHTLAALASVPRLAGVLLVLAPQDDLGAGLDLPGPAGRVWSAHCGGASRADSVRQGLQCLLEAGALATDWVLVHDAARCLITPAAVEGLIDACIDDEVGGLLALPLPDTLKQAQPVGSDRVERTVERTGKWLAQTPQMFRLGMLLQALQRAQAEADPGITDESSAIEALGLQPRLVLGSAQNFKVTYPEDFMLAEAVLRSRSL